MKLIINPNQESLSVRLMDEIKQVILKTEYDPIHISTLAGVLEMLKIEFIRNNA